MTLDKDTEKEIKIELICSMVWVLRPRKVIKVGTKLDPQCVSSPLSGVYSLLPFLNFDEIGFLLFCFELIPREICG